jgi:predicted RNase H-like HicB family nuclease
MQEVLLNLHVEALDEGGYLATSSELPGLLAQGRTIAETVEIAQDVARKLIDSYREHGDPLPAALTPTARTSGDMVIAVSVA